MKSDLVNKQLQYTYCPISHEVKESDNEIGPLIEYNMANIFLEKSYTKCSVETIYRPIFKKSKLNIFPVDQ